MAKVRGFNPIWANFNLDGLIFDDTYYLYVLSNQFPYLPSDEVFLDINGATQAPTPIQYLANGTLPVKLFFTAGTVFRLEFRQNDGTAPPSQSDALIYVVENYTPGESSSGPIPGFSLNSDNQISNPQFPEVSFSSPHTFKGITNTAIEIAPSWQIVVGGTGNLIVTRQSLTSSDEVPTNAPYGLIIQTLGFDSAYLRQRFDENGTIWSQAAVSTSITARTADSIPYKIRVSLQNNAPSAQSVTIDSYTLTTAWQEFVGAATVPESNNTTNPSTAHTELRISLPRSGSVALTSIQLVSQDTPVDLPFEQETVARQKDHLFHYYQNSILLEPKSSLLTGANWSLNPWQFRAPAIATLEDKTAYTADQTIIHQQTAGSQVAIGRGSESKNRPLEIRAVTANNRFAVIEYIDATTARPYWGSKLSALLKARIATTHGTSVKVKARLIYRATLPATLGANEPILAWSGSGDPSFSAGWTAITPKNDPAYTLTSTMANMPFEGMQLPASTSAAMTLGIVLYTVDNMVQTGTADSVQMERCSLVPNEFATDSNVLTFDDNFSRCQFYYEKSYPVTSIPGVDNTANGILLFTQPVQHSSGTFSKDTGYRFQFQINYEQVKRSVPTLVIRSPSAVTANLLQFAIRTGTTTPTPTSGGNPRNIGAVLSPGWTIAYSDQDRVVLQANDVSQVMEITISSPAAQQEIQLHYTADARLAR